MPHRRAMQRHVLAAYADVTARDLAVLDEPAGDVFGRVDSDGETDALRGQDNGGVDANYFAARIDQRPAGIAGVQGGVRLDDIIDQPAGVGPEGTAQGADDSRGDGALEAVGIADSNGNLADAYAPGIPEARRMKLRRVDPHDRQVRVRIVTDHVGIGMTAIRKGDLDPVGVMHDMAVGEHKPVGGDDESGAAAGALPLSPPNLDVHHRRPDLVSRADDEVGPSVVNIEI